ncbi:Calcipressin-like protein [Fulvia fulva]|uniref:Calcipressin-like protein n=1 Tax=Passalora fulva TaxID=5499 RepID=A0A9Q8L7E0_PASFU|nr:Calcipressin-like protein [Fulvia fulva]KAK4635172.1 Calcipressin-like protein [Fulvia fulva]KAK4636381.1 Calcipressin-like protein [Fulvia fulva]UJO12177.1 Calcipressin-like protein [Fulvia fulva]WPV10307.1 Calcipressin-like protein [Fulvia fulva]WPV23160.1 Calcipressin-like protein [Fulvia fulva]
MATAIMQMSPAPSPTSPSRRRSPNLSIDLSDLPALSQPTPPSNTLLITNLNAPEIFTAANLESITQAINQHAKIHTFSPLKSMRRVIVTFWTTEDAIAIRQVLDGETVLGSRVRVYFGQKTKIEQGDQHLHLPQSQKLFFISPPPSPPVGWEMRNEEPPNKDVHAEDLADALAKLHARPDADAALREDTEVERPARLTVNTRQRSGTGTIVYDPQEHGHSPDLPAIAVEDTTESPQPLSPMEGVEKKFVHTARPPVELMEQ